MKSIVLTAALLAVTPALATTPVKPAPTPVPAPVAAPAVAKLSVDLPIEALVADPRSKAVLEANMPGVTTHPMYDSFKAMTLGQLAPMSQGQITDAILAKVTADLAAIK